MFGCIIATSKCTLKLVLWTFNTSTGKLYSLLLAYTLQWYILLVHDGHISISDINYQYQESSSLLVPSIDNDNNEITTCYTN